MAFNPNQIVLDGFTQHDFAFTMYISGTVTDADIGKAVSLDTSAPATVKLAADGETIYGRIFQIEDRSQEGVTTVTVETRFRKRLPKTAATIAIGDGVVGAGGGLVRAGVAGTDGPFYNVVLANDDTDDFVIVEQ